MPENFTIFQPERQGLLKVYLTGGLIYMIGDTIAGLIQNQFDIIRALGIFIVGSTLYAFEITNYFKWIESKVKNKTGVFTKWIKATLALLYFNPLWIARHMCFVIIAGRLWEQLGTHIISSALIAFIVNIPVSVIANYVIQNKVSPHYRFWASALFSGVMAIYYSMSMVWF